MTAYRIHDTGNTQSEEDWEEVLKEFQIYYEMWGFDCPLSDEEVEALIGASDDQEVWIEEVA